MSRQHTLLLMAFLGLLIVVMGGAPILKGGFYIGKHEGDTMHLAELVLRMADGQWPHLDFMTPIGVLALAPISVFVKAGAGLGHAIFYAQMLVAALLLLPVLRVAASRLTGLWPFLYGGFVMLLCLALVHGEAQSAISISMHYNRWAWAVAYVIIPLAVLAPVGAPRPWLDGALIGLGLAALVLMKVTYFVAFAPGILVALLARKQGLAILAAILSGLAVAAVVTVLAGTEFWLAYLKDLLTVATGDSRQAPGDSFTNVIAAPLYMGGSLTLIAAVIFLRQAGRAVEGLALLVLMPGFFYVAYQNFGNDPQWLYLVALLVFVLMPGPGVQNGFGWDLRDALRITGILALAFGGPSAINLAFSPWRHLAAETEDTVPLLTRLPAHDDVLTTEPRAYTANLARPYDLPGDPYERYRPFTERADAAFLNGEELPECQVEGAIGGWFELVTEDLEVAGFGGAALMGTDLYSAYWMFGDFKNVRGAAPWYYGGIPGVENADYLVVPLCPMALRLRNAMMTSLEEDGWTLDEKRRTELYILVAPSRP
ncbi:hypothetical protein DEA8626_03675 [Defluviimonas aquaemixtae]|uniref:DUF2029 domain-containing protein n=1 Tax=Albidovulum aquaemixtae TaxID=1542388 RepID=A0A2R8BMI8_9RHOB|nr:hypothetical protein [Defluviimonas aquaemixtae]SPH24624.1 hypothetical protein DEA8626_03675 [Defluviimonas aquaemixtae]